MRSPPLISILLLGLGLLGGVADAQTVRDRMVTDVRVERDSDHGTWRILATVTIASNDAGPADLSYVVRTTLGDANGPQLGSDETVNVTIVTHPSCTAQAQPPCSGGSCPSAQAAGAPVAGSCEPYLVNRPGCTPYQVCACWYRGIETEAAVDVDVDAGQKITVRIFKTPAALPDTTCTPPNDELTITVGSAADDATLFGSWKDPSPIGGQADDGAADGATTFLDQAGLIRQGDGPYEFWGAPGTAVALTHGAPGSGLAVSLWAGIPRTSFAVLPLLGMSFDLDLTTILPIYDGIFGGNPAVVTNASGVFALSFALPPGPTRRLAAVQGLSLDPGAAFGIALTSRNDLGVQDTATLSTPALPPYSSGGPAPLFGGTARYPFPRDVIVPNAARASSGTTAADGDLVSLLGSGFDATDPTANSLVVNGVPATLFVVRPNEILFRLVPGHRSAIGGPVTITTPVGTFSGDPERMEHHVFAVPATSMTMNETIDVASPVASGGLRARPGVHAARGSVATSDLVELGDGALPPGVVLRVLLAEVDPANGQLRTRCQQPTNCFATSTEPQTQSPAPPNPWNDVRLELLPAPSQPAVASLDDEGPGSSVLGTLLSSGADPHLAISFHAGATGSVAPFRYLLVVSF